MDTASTKNHCTRKNAATRTFTERAVVLVFAAAFLAALLGCYTPSPLYGTWVDNSGNTIRFQSDGSFSAKVKTTTGTESYQGTYVVNDNVLVFEIESPSYNVVSEWDVRGSMLYLVWIDSGGESVSLTLYLSSK